MSGPVVVVSEDGVEVDRNDAAREQFGTAGLVELFDNPSWEAFCVSLRSDSDATMTARFRDGRVFDAMLMSGPAGIGVAFYDVTRYARAIDEEHAKARLVDLLVESLAAMHDSPAELARRAEVACRVLAGVLGAQLVEVELGDELFSWPVADSSREGTQLRAEAEQGCVSGLVPLTVGERGLGNLRWWRREPLTDTETRVLETIAAQAGVVLDHARLSSSEVSTMSRDPLTGLLSRQGGLVVLAVIPAPYTVALIDVDSLKSVNAEAGSKAGDDVLRRLARALSQGRFGDVVVRWSGEEFLVALPGATPEGAGRRLERVLEEAEKSLWIGRRPVTFSCGIATVTDEGLDKGLGDADRALFFAKKQGGGRVALADHC